MATKKSIVLVLVDIRSAHNVGSVLRTADGLGAQKTYLSGITPYPETDNDERLPHIRRKITQKIIKTSLGAENSQAWERHQNTIALLSELRRAGYALVAVEQTAKSLPLEKFVAPKKTALIFGNEIDGLNSNVLDICELSLEIPMAGKKESFNVAIAAALALYQTRLSTASFK